MKINDTNGRFLVIIYYNKKQKHENLTSFLDVVRRFIYIFKREILKEKSFPL